MVDIGTLGGPASFAYAVNNSGVVVGDSNVPAKQFHGYSWTDRDGIVDLAPLAGYSQSTAFLVNNSGLVAGASYGPSSTFRATLWLLNGSSSLMK
jgi:probable HAF family extracellular repeat protein